MRLMTIFFLLVSTFCFAQELKLLRSDYSSANQDEEITNMLHEQLSAVSKENNMVMLAYKGAVSTLKAKFAKGIKNKKMFFKEGAELLEFTIASEPENIEIRCLRLGVQENSPKIIGYKQHIRTDKQFILDRYKTIKDKEVQNFVKGYVQLSDLFSDAEKQLF